jgi:hypothetical protein
MASFTAAEREKNHLRTLVFAWAAVTALVISSACSKGGDSHSSAAPATKAAVASPTASPVPNVMIPMPPKSQKNGSELDRQSGQSSIDPRPVSNSGSPHLTFIEPLHMKGDEIFQLTTQLGAVTQGIQTGFKDASGMELFYSGTSQDDLTKVIEDMSNSKSPDQRKRDLDFSSRVGISKFEANLFTHSISISIAFEENGQIKTNEYIGSLSPSERMVKIGSLKGPGKLERTELEAICMDRDEACTVLYVKLLHRTNSKAQNSTKNSFAEAHMIARKSNPVLDIAGGGYSASHNSDYDGLVSMFMNPERRPSKIEKKELFLSETVNGPSTVTVNLLFRDGLSEESFGFQGPLVRTQDHGIDTQSMMFSGNNVNLEMQKIPSEFYYRGDAQAKISGPLLSNSVQSVRMITNDGRGTIRVEMLVPADAADAKADKLIMTVAARPKQIRGLEFK